MDNRVNESASAGWRPGETRGASAGDRQAERSASVPAWHAVDQFRTAILASGLGDPGRILADGEVHRFYVEGDRAGSKNGWYALHLDGIPAGIFASWRSGEIRTWCSVSKDRQTPAQQADIRRLVEQAKAQRAADTATRHADAAHRAQNLLDSASRADTSHPYLVTKQIAQHGVRQQGAVLVVPVYVGGVLASLQTIYGDGTKRFLPGGRIAGGWFLIDNGVARSEILICEGFATAATLHEQIGAACYCAFNCNNLLAVARYVRALRPGANIILCADNDQWTEDNPGVTQARAAAIAVRGKLLIPDFSRMDLSSKPTDWNDWYRMRRQRGCAA